ALLSGATLVLADPADLLPGARLTEVMAEQGVTFAMLPPAALAELRPDEQLPPGMTVLLGGEAPPPGLVERLATDGRTVFNSYGPTEATGCVRVSGAWRDGCGGAPPIGRPIGGVRAYVLDGAGRPAPVGV